MDDEELLPILSNIEGRASAALGEGLSASLLIGPLLLFLVQRGVVPLTIATGLIDRALLGLEERHHLMADADRAANDHARRRLQYILSMHSPGPPSTPSA